MISRSYGHRSGPSFLSSESRLVIIRIVDRCSAHRIDNHVADRGTALGCGVMSLSLAMAGNVGSVA